MSVMVNAQDSAPLGISVVICCYNSAARLPETLKHLAGQVVSAKIPWEVILVNNASTDNTAEVAVRVWQETSALVPLEVLAETRPGKSYALETAFMAAQYGILVIVDDDNWLNLDYLQHAFHLMRQHLEIGALGGRITAAFETEPPPWFQQFQSCYAVGPQGKVSGDITDYKPHVAGAGMVVRKSAYELLKQHGFRWILSDGKNGILNTGEDLELCYALALAGYRIWYDENLGLTHYMPKSRLTQESLLELIRRNRIAGPLQAGYEIAWRGIHTSALKFYFYRVLMLGLWLAKGAVKFLLGRQTWLSLRIAFADWFQSLFDYGVLRRIFRNDLPRIQQLKEKRPICQ